MKEERLDILIDLYEHMEEEGSMHIPYKIDTEWLACASIDIEYLEDAGYVKIEDNEGSPYTGWDLFITHKGMDVVEQHRINFEFQARLNNEL